MVMGVLHACTGQDSQGPLYIKQEWACLVCQCEDEVEHFPIILLGYCLLRGDVMIYVA